MAEAGAMAEAATTGLTPLEVLARAVQPWRAHTQGGALAMARGW